MRNAVLFFSASCVVFAWACVGDSSSDQGTTVDAGTDAANPPANDASADAGSTDAGSTDAGSIDAGTDAGPTVTHVEMGDEMACALLSDGTVWCWGTGTFGELGSAPSSTVYAPAPVMGLSGITSISVGTDSACAIDEGGSLYCWGRNTNGELGHDPTDSANHDIKCQTSDYCQTVPAKVQGILVKQVSVGLHTTCAVTTSGAVVCFGAGDLGQLGQLTDAGVSFAPTVVQGFPLPLVEVTTRFPGDSVCAIDSAKKLWCWGLNNDGQIGHPAGTLGDTPLSVAGGTYYISPPSKVSVNGDGKTDFDNVLHVHASRTTCAVRLDGSVWCWGSNTAAFLGNGVADTLPHPTPTQVANVANAIDVRGGNSICALSSVGAVSCWGAYQALTGNNVDAGCKTYSGNLDTCTTMPSVVSSLLASSFDVDHYAAIALDPSGIAKAWGNNGAGELGHTPGTHGDDTGLMSNPTPTPVLGLP